MQWRLFRSALPDGNGDRRTDEQHVRELFCRVLQGDGERDALRPVPGRLYHSERGDHRSTSLQRP